jgi:hypothetical protein
MRLTFENTVSAEDNSISPQHSEPHARCRGPVSLALKWRLPRIGSEEGSRLGAHNPITLNADVAETQSVWGVIEAPAAPGRLR